MSSVKEDGGGIITWTQGGPRLLLVSEAGMLYGDQFSFEQLCFSVALYFMIKPYVRDVPTVGGKVVLLFQCFF